MKATPSRHAAPGWCAAVVERTAPLLARQPAHRRPRPARRDRGRHPRPRSTSRSTRRAADAAAAWPPGAAARHVTTRYWYRFGSVAEARRWQERALAVAPTRTAARVGLLYGLGISLLQQGLPPIRWRCWTAHCELPGTPALRLAGPDPQRQGGRPTAGRRVRRIGGAAARRDGGGPPGRGADLEAKALGNLAVLHHDLGEYPEARVPPSSRCVNAGRGDDWGVALDHVNYVAAVLNRRLAEAAGPCAVAARHARLCRDRTDHRPARTRGRHRRRPYRARWRRTCSVQPTPGGPRPAHPDRPPSNVASTRGQRRYERRRRRVDGSRPTTPARRWPRRTASSSCRRAEPPTAGR